MADRYFLEYKAVRLIMMGGNLEQSEFRALIEESNAFMCKDEQKDFDKCKYSGTLLGEYPEAFLSNVPDDLARQTAINLKLAKNGTLTAGNRKFVDLAVRMASIAAREKLTPVLQPGDMIVDNFKICKAASLPPMAISDFIKMLKDKAE